MSESDTYATSPDGRFVYCPLCEYRPTSTVLWHCAYCDHAWNSLATKGLCPKCHNHHETASCPRCGAYSPNEAWFHEWLPPPFLHCCSNCAKPVNRDRYPQPSNPRATVMRYLTMEKFRLFLRERAIYLARLDRFEDPFEGSLPRRALAHVASGQRAGFYTEEADRRLWTQQFYVSCWHLASQESDAMWRLYCGDEGGVCLVSTYARLAKLRSGTRLDLGLVRYIDYRTQNLTWWDSHSPMMHKRKAYEHEKEVRIVAPAGACNFLLSSREGAIAHLQQQPLGYRLACDPAQLILRILVSPHVGNDYFTAVVEMAGSFAPPISKRVQWSRMRELPKF